MIAANIQVLFSEHVLHQHYHAVFELIVFLQESQLQPRVLNLRTYYHVQNVLKKHLYKGHECMIE